MNKLLLIPLALCCFGCAPACNDVGVAPDELIVLSINGKSFMESNQLPLRRLSEQEIGAAERYILANNDYSSYHLLFAVQRDARNVYLNIPDDIKARIICSALGHLTFMNDWGYLAPEDSFDGDAALALIATGFVAIPYLFPLLTDSSPAPLFGSEGATMSHVYTYRRMDFAYRYACLIIGWRPTFDPNHLNRNKEIERLRNHLQIKH